MVIHFKKIFLQQINVLSLIFIIMFLYLTWHSVFTIPLPIKSSYKHVLVNAAFILGPMETV